MQAVTVRKSILVLAAALACSALGSASASAAPSSVSPPGTSKLSVGDYFSCFVPGGDAGNVACWGAFADGQLGDKWTGDQNTWPLTDINQLRHRLFPFDAIPVTGVSGMASLDSGGKSSCSIKSGGKLFCWGTGQTGSLGFGLTDQVKLTPTEVTGLAGPVVDVAIGDGHSCAVIDDGTVECWGANGVGQSTGTTAVNSGNIAVPSTVPGVGTEGEGLTKAIDVEVGTAFSCALLENGNVKCWGYGSNGELGPATTGDAPGSSVRTVTGLSNVVQIATDAQHTCALIDDGTVKCWGAWPDGSGGTGFKTSATPVAISGATGMTRISAGFAHNCGLVNDGTVKCWGWNTYSTVTALVGVGDVTAVAVPGITGATDLSAGMNHTCVLLSDDSVKCWGRNNEGQLGISMVVPGTPLGSNRSDSPVSVGLTTKPPDTTPPTPSFGTPYKFSGGFGTSTWVFPFKSNEDRAIWLCSFDGGTYAYCGSRWYLDTRPSFSTEEYAYFKNSIADGEHTMAIKAYDEWGNLSDAVTYSFTADTQPPPDPTFESKPSNPSGKVNAEFTFGNTEAGVTYECSLDFGTRVACPNPYTTTALTAGSHTLQVWAVDAAGNSSANPAYYSWMVDFTAPKKPIFNGVASNPSGSGSQLSNGGATNKTKVEISFYPDGYVPDATFLCSFNGGSYSACTSPYTWNAGSVGDYTLDVKVVNKAGVESPSSRFSWSYTDGPSSPTLQGVPTGTVSSTSAMIMISSDDPSATFLCSLDGGAYQACTNPWQINGLSNGSHYVSVKSKDSSGKESAPTTSATWTVDGLDISFTTKPSSPSGTDVAFAFTLSQPLKPGQAVFCYRDPAPGSPPTMIECSAGTPFDVTGLSAGSHTLYVVVASTTTPGPPVGMTQYTWTVGSGGGGGGAKPAAPAFGAKPSDPSKAASGQISFTGDAGATFECQLDSGSWSACTSPFTYSSLADGSHTFKVRAVKDGQTGDPSTHTWTVDTTAPAAPTITSKPAATTTDQNASIAFTGSGESGASFECKLDTAAWAACSSPTVLSGVSVGSHSFQVREVDSAGNSGPAAAADWTVQSPSGPCNPRAVPPTPSSTVKLTRVKGGIWVMNAGSVFNTGGDTRACAQILTIQVSVDVTRPLDSLAHPTVASFENGILAWTGKEVRRNGKQPRWMRVGNRIGRWTGWVQIKQ